MSETPRTDEHLRMKEENGHVVIVSRGFARQLETELERKDKLIEQMRDALKIVYNNHGYGRGNITDSELAVTAALEAAERGEE